MGTPHGSSNDKPPFAPFNQQGFALVAAISVCALLLVLGSGALMMSQLGYLGAGAERRYQLANWAADYAVNAGVIGQTPASGNLASGAGFAYESLPGGDYRLIHGTGTLGNARVVKIAVVPVPGSVWGGMNTVGGTIDLGGNSAIAGCDTDVATVCIGSGINAFGVLDVTAQQGETTLVSCPGSPGQFKGVMGDPPIQQRTPRTDLTDLYFNAADTDELMSLIGAGFGVDPQNLTFDPTPADCSYTGTDNCATTSNTEIECGDEIFDLSDGAGNCDTFHIASPVELTIDNNGLAYGFDSKTIVSQGRVTLERSTGSATTGSSLNIFADHLTVDMGAKTNVHGGFFYSRTIASINVGSNANFGTVANPLLFIAQGDSLTFGGNGGGDVYGMILGDSDAVNFAGNGNWSLHGSMVSNSDVSGTATGNWSVRLNMDVLQNLAQSLPGTMQQPSCGVPNNSFLSNTKITLY